MNRKKIFDSLNRAKRPIDFFGLVENEKELKKVYLDFVKQIHPDTATNGDENISTRAFVLLQEIYHLGVEELKKGIYKIKDTVKLYEKEKPLFSLNIKKNAYDIFELKARGEIADIYCGVKNKKELIYLKLVLDPEDNFLLKEEYDTLKQIDFSKTFTIPKPLDLITINDCSAIIFTSLEGENLVDIMKRHPNGLPIQVVMWIMERLFSQIGYLHSKYIVHGNLIPENIMINTKNHSVSLTGFSFSIPNANTVDAKYKIRNDDYSAKEVSKTAVVLPQSDIYSVGKLAVYLLGGNILNNGMPISIDKRIREFIRNLLSESVNQRPNDAWKLWDEWIKLRSEVFGKKQFEIIDI